jgi:hypothetical protein
MLAGMAFVLACTEKCFGWTIAGMLWWAWACHDRKKEAIERLRRPRG